MKLQHKIDYIGRSLRILMLVSLGVLISIGVLLILHLKQEKSISVLETRLLVPETSTVHNLYKYFYDGASLKVLTDNEERTFIRFEASPKGAETYNGMVFVGDFSVPGDAELEIRWRVKGAAPVLDLHISETAQNTVSGNQGEDFILSVKKPGTEWKTDRFPIRDFIPNEWQADDAVTDGSLDHHAIGSIHVGMLPGSLVSIDISNLSFVWKINGTPYISFLGLLILFSLIHILRTYGKLFSQSENTADIFVIIQTRIGFFLISLTLLISWISDKYLLSEPLALIAFGLLFTGLVLEDFLPDEILKNRILNFRYAPAALFLLYNMETVPHSVLALLFILMILPSLIQKDRFSFIFLTALMLFLTPFHPLFKGTNNLISSMVVISFSALVSFLLVEYLAHHGKRQEMNRALVLYRGVFASSSDAIFTLDTEGRIINGNNAFVKLTGLPHNLLIGKDISSIVSPEDQPKFSGDQEFSRDKVNRYDARILGQGGQWHDVYVSEHPIFERGRLAGIQVITTDLTDRRKLEQELRETNERLEALVHLDGLTGVNNRRYFDTQLDVEWRRCLRAQVPLSLIMIDIDHFKLYNDSYGHQLGDECLSRIAQNLKSQLNRAGDLVARYGGEEFVIILPAADGKEALQVAEHLKAGIDALAIEHPASPSSIVTLSMGVSTVQPTEVSGQTQYFSLLKKADKALYRAKKAGRNRIEVSNGE